MYCYMLQQQHENIHSSKIYLNMMTTAKNLEKRENHFPDFLILFF